MPFHRTGFTSYLDFSGHTSYPLVVAAKVMLIKKARERKIAADAWLQHQCLNINKDFQFLIILEEWAPCL
jgi:hypothetical protein